MKNAPAPLRHKQKKRLPCSAVCCECAGIAANLQVSPLLEGILKRYPEIGDRPQKVLKNIAIYSGRHHCAYFQTKIAAIVVPPPATKHSATLPSSTTWSRKQFFDFFGGNFEAILCPQTVRERSKFSGNYAWNSWLHSSQKLLRNELRKYHFM